ncbi:site-specific DNA-methyltransferase [Halorubrum ezzemoulense]|uniref:Type II methyltransferase n=1 Tax=Halorubrum ezzemoulense TaxID=337243 RepID=A0ABT4Z847_HALEZ|nr:site-specific DNA-methyltransferase [Halorubrum ezzemoulense]MDB2294255.1 site-specific DNA-methyltransferase [Halorubrum ezzemoulense]
MADDDEIEIPLPDEIDPEPPELDEIVVDGEVRTNQIYNGDCLELLKELPDESVQTIITSPPYNIGKRYEEDVPFDEYLETHRKVIEECYRVLKPEGSIFWQVAVYTKDGHHYPLDVKFFPIFEELGFIPRNRIMWPKSHGLHGKIRFSARHETMLWFTKTEDHYFNLDPVRVPQKWPNKKSHRGDNKGEVTSNPDGKNPGDVWDIGHVKWNHEEQTMHPAQFPEELAERALLSTTREGDLVVDPYAGAGTVATVAQDNDREYLGAEKEYRYWKIAQLRLAHIPDANGNFVNLKQVREAGREDSAEYGYHRRPVEPEDVDDDQTTLADMESDDD